jgi:hypothetical protein
MFAPSRRFSTLDALPAYAAVDYNPLAFIGFLMEKHGYESEGFRRKLDADLVSMERKLGMTSLWSWNGLQMQDMSDYESLSKGLINCSTHLAVFENILQFEASAGEFCLETLEAFEALREKISVKRLSAPVYDSMTEHVRFHNNLADGRRNQAHSLLKRTQVQVSMVGAPNSISMRNWTNLR